MQKAIVRNKNLRSRVVTVIREQPNLGRLGPAGTRLKLDRMLLSVHGQTVQEWQKLSEEERDVLRQMAREADPAWGLSHQADAIGALGLMRDKGSLLQLSEIASDARADVRLQIAATHALGEIGGDQVRPIIRSLLRAKAPEVRAQAASALAKCGTKADIAVLEPLSRRDRTFAGDAAGEAITVLRTRLHRAGRA